MKRIELQRAEIIPFYKSEDILKETELKNGAISFRFNAKTKINDRSEDSPIAFDRCQYIVDTAEDANWVRNTIREGNIVDMVGTEGRYKNQDGKWNSYVKIFKISGIDIKPTNEDDLPF